MRITKTMLNNKITYANQMLDAEITCKFYNEFYHIKANGENLFRGTAKECCNFLDGLVQYKLLTH